MGIGPCKNIITACRKASLWEIDSPGTGEVARSARGGTVARRAGGRELCLYPKLSCLRETLSPTACGRSPLPEGAKEFFDSLL